MPEECLWAQFKRIRVTQADLALPADQRPETRERSKARQGFRNTQSLLYFITLSLSLSVLYCISTLNGVLGVQEKKKSVKKMNTVISRAFAKIASPSPTLSTQKWQHYATLFLQSSAYATTATSKTPRQYLRRGGAESSSSSSKSKSESTAEVEAAAARATATASSEWARPSEIPFQAKIVNSVNVIGYVHVPVQFEASPDGKCWAGTVLTQTHQISSPPSSPDSPPLWYEPN